MPVPVIMEMTDAHRMFLQAIMCRGILNAREVRQLYKDCSNPTESDVEPAKIQQFVSTINSTLRRYSMEVRKGISEVDGSHHYALVNVVESDITKLASDYTVNELELFKKMIGVMVESDLGVISSIEALNLTETLEKKMTKSAAEGFIKQLVADKWLHQDQGEITLAVRALIELDQYLRQTYQGILLSCNICGQIALKSQKCFNCEMKMHVHCASRYFLDREPRVCPRCKQAWQHEIRPHRKRKNPSQDSATDNSGAEEPQPGTSGSSR